MYDIHTHTTNSDGRNTIREMVRAAEAADLELLAITDHYYTDTYSIDWLESAMKELRDLQTNSSVQLLLGIEGTVTDLDKANISFTKETAELVDLVLVDFGGRTSRLAREPYNNKHMLKEKVLDCIENLCANPSIDIIAHPLNLGKFPHALEVKEFDPKQIDRLANAFVQHDTYFEIMNQMYYWYPKMPVTEFFIQYSSLVSELCKRGVRFVTGSDSHSVCGVGNMTWCSRIITEAKVPPSQIVSVQEIIGKKK